ncbi:MAG TPA: D-sedoheptulose 7-phosphate isomerase [Candidatus Binatia bacterium]|nr:D-sedoheptulose 7-phosphate isomerase [Candidatus Binatia bacterium]
MTSSLNLAGVFTDAIKEHLSIIRQLEGQEDSFERAAILITDSLLRGNKLLCCGNGGSAADSQHLAAELVGRFRRRRSPLPAMALTTDTSVLTAIANDCGYDEIFDRQVEALCQAGDVVIGISASGNSRNVCAALQKAHQMHASTVAMTGGCGGRMASLADVCIRVPSSDPARIQEAHILCGHILCEWIEIATCISQAVEAGSEAR